MRAALVLVLVGLAACPDPRAARPQDEIELPLVDEAARATAWLATGDSRFTLFRDGTVLRDNRQVTIAAVERADDPADLDMPSTSAEPLCMGAPFAALESDGRLVAGLRGRQIGWRRIVGQVHYGNAIHAAALVFAAHDARARVLVDLVHATGAAIVVQHQPELVLGLDFSETERDVGPARRVVTLRLEPTTDVQAALDATSHTFRCGELEMIYPVHLNVVEGVTAQQLVDAIVKLRLAGVRMIGLGNA
jgi:hypothetical protein